MESKKIMGIIEEADCNIETCFVDSKRYYAPLGWTKTLIETTWRAAIKESLLRVQEQFDIWVNDTIDESGVLLIATINLHRIIQEEAAK